MMKSKKALKNIFLINAIIEIAGGIMVMINPNLLLYSTESTSVTLNVCKAFGIAIFTMGIVSYQLYRHELLAIQGSKMIALAFILYHVLVAFVLYSMYQAGMTPHVGATVVHVIIAFVFTYFYSQTIGQETN